MIDLADSERSALHRQAGLAKQAGKPASIITEHFLPNQKQPFQFQRLERELVHDRSL
jgi:hypothetical protein